MHTEQTIIVALKGLLADLASPKAPEAQERLLTAIAHYEDTLARLKQRWKPRGWRDRSEPRRITLGG